MIIQSLELADFRNYETLSLFFDKGINIFYGDNAQGKTNLLEALYLSLTTKSHKSVKDKDCIRFGTNEAHIRTITDKEGLTMRVDMHLRASKTKGIALDGVRIKKTGDFLKKLSARVIIFAPEDLDLIKGAPLLRRRYLDLELCQQDASYLDALYKYNKTLQERSATLAKLGKMYGKTARADETGVLLDVYDKTLIENGLYIINKRKEFIDDMMPVLKEIHSKISGGVEDLTLSYKPNIEPDKYEEELRLNRTKDLITMKTNCGPHRDDLDFHIQKILNGTRMNRQVDVRKFGSQGQQRTTALSMKLAEIELVKKRQVSAPIMLLDDVLPELDENRQKELLSAIGSLQTIITCTGLDDFVMSRLNIDKIFKVVDGKVTADN